MEHGLLKLQKTRKKIPIFFFRKFDCGKKIRNFQFSPNCPQFYKTISKK